MEPKENNITLQKILINFRKKPLYLQLSSTFSLLWQALTQLVLSGQRSSLNIIPPRFATNKGPLCTWVWPAQTHCSESYDFTHYPTSVQPCPVFQASGSWTWLILRLTYVESSLKIQTPRPYARNQPQKLLHRPQLCQTNSRILGLNNSATWTFS